MTIRKSIRVDCPCEQSFRIFCEEIGKWWPGGFGGKDARLTLEPRVGGSFYETRPDGSVYEIGKITAYRAPAVVAFTWRAPSWDVNTQVEIKFIPEGASTRVELEHSGWEQKPALTDARKNYDSGWETILGHYVKYTATVQ
jgi:uncharacterized protein YndB with AHSA1/START domain